MQIHIVNTYMSMHLPNQEVPPTAKKVDSENRFEKIAGLLHLWHACDQGMGGVGGELRLPQNHWVVELLCFCVFYLFLGGGFKYYSNWIVPQIGMKIKIFHSNGLKPPTSLICNPKLCSFSDMCFTIHGRHESRHQLTVFVRQNQWFQIFF